MRVYMMREGMRGMSGRNIGSVKREDSKWRESRELGDEMKSGAQEKGNGNKEREERKRSDTT